MSGDCDLCGQHTLECQCYLNKLEERTAFLEGNQEKIFSNQLEFDAKLYQLECNKDSCHLCNEKEAFNYTAEVMSNVNAAKNPKGKRQMARKRSAKKTESKR